MVEVRFAGHVGDEDLEPLRECLFADGATLLEDSVCMWCGSLRCFFSWCLGQLPHRTALERWHCGAVADVLLRSSTRSGCFSDR